MENIKLFKNLKETQIDVLLGELGVKTKIYKKGEVIIKKGDRLTSVLTVLVGEVKIVTENIDGNECVFSIAKDGDSFCLNYLCSQVKTSPVNVIANKQTGILFLPYEKMFEFHADIMPIQTRLIKNLLYFVAKENDEINVRLFCLDKTTIREKILAYLNFQAQKFDTKAFAIPLSREELAKYLCVDRSALSRELSNMQKSGIIEYKKNEFTLLKR